LKFDEIIETGGDSYARYIVRMKEMGQSLSIVEQLIDNIPDGEFQAKTKAVLKLPKGEFYSRVETARGEFGVYIISEGGTTPYRIKFRSPGFSNLSALDHIARGSKIGDLVAIMGTLDFLNENYPREDKRTWKLNYNQFHFFNNYELAQLINKLIRISTGDALTKDVLANLTLKELLIRIMQMQNLHEVNTNMHELSQSSRFAYVVEYIRLHLTEKLNIDALSQMAFMSKPSFFRAFKHELGISPVDYIIRERIHFAKQLMNNPYNSISEACFKAGFNNLNYFSRAFKKIEGITASQYKAGMRNA